MTPTPRTIIGTVEILKTREYAVNPDDNVMTTTVTAMVQPGIFPLFRQNDRIFWEMTGEVCYQQPEVEFEDIPDMEGAFFMHLPSVKPTGNTITFPSKSFTCDDFEDFRTNDPLTNPDSPHYRLAITLSEDQPDDDRWTGWGW